MNIAQPALSRQMAAIEDEMGTLLFERLPRGVALTRAGSELVRHSARILDELGDVKAHVVAAAEGRRGTLRIGVIPNQSANPHLIDAVKAFTKDVPDVTIVVTPMSSARQEIALKDGTLDAGLIVWRSPLDAGLTGRFVQRDHMAVAIPQAISRNLGPVRTLEQLAGQNFVIYERDRFPALQDSISMALKRAGIRPLKTPMAADFQALIGYVVTGIGCAIVPYSYQELCPPGVSIYDIQGIDMVYNIEIAYRTRNNDPTMHRFIDAVVSSSRQGRQESETGTASS
ncbi:putative HTH-type transcriptional regulator TfdS [Hyphomicrobiales bacterium]|nr:putative HTH-type transcriptional regulator TfdS [Hyphomicrobiales bacterium]CAH1698840.1 HTH-type transcriptional regulator tfdS [Hyphomicrobiales bacterium]CAI0342487.1 putative HTH-type transcriptional regulator TfdS [Hyphomicrobiales bacterium]